MAKKHEPVWCPYCLANNERHAHNECLPEKGKTYDDGTFESEEALLIEYKVIQPAYSELCFTFFDLSQLAKRKGHETLHAPHFLYVCTKCNYPEIQEKLI